jgi:hypothetical protein
MILSIRADNAEDHILTALAITDTANHLSLISDCHGYKSKTLFYTWTLNQAGTLQITGSRDGVNFVNLGAAQAVSAATGPGAVDAGVVSQLGLYYPFLQIVAKATVAPTSGTLDLWLDKLAD